MNTEYEITVVIAAYNRGERLAMTLESVLSQEVHHVPYEVIVVDNNSTDNTKQIVESFISEGHKNLSYVFEPNQGSSYARNTGVAAASSEIIAFADDDVTVAKDWIAAIKQTFDEHPEVDCIGGRVLPRWLAAAPAWLTRDHWPPLALQDYGDKPLLINLKNPLCLVSANLAFRRETFVDAGLFAPELQRVKNKIGSMEDAEFMDRYWRAGRDCLYVPEILAETDVTFERMSKAYHRRWHTGHGYFYAIMRSEEIERASSRLYDVPAHIYKQAVIDAVAWLCSVLHNSSRAFLYEMRLRFFAGFFTKRRSDYLSSAHRGFLGEIVNFTRSRVSKTAYDQNPRHWS